MLDIFTNIKNFNLNNYLVNNRFLWHVIFWLVYAMSRFSSYYITLLYYEPEFISFMLIIDIGRFCLIYATIWLYKKNILVKKYLRYFFTSFFLWLIFLAVLVTFQKKYLQDIPSIASAKWLPIFIEYLGTYIILFFLVTTSKYFKDNFIHQFYENEKQKQLLRTEIDHLKAQISPHFLFNTLNNFYGLAVEKSNKLPDLMIRLSELLRYSLYETGNERVLLSKEIAYLKSYIELEKIRLEDNLEIEFDIKIDAPSDTSIAPLILIIFFENAFKHAKKSEKEILKIIIKLNASADKVIYLTVQNNYQLEQIDNNIEHKGIGLDIVTKRLNLLYPNGNHKLNIRKDEIYFNIQLNMNLN